MCDQRFRSYFVSQARNAAANAESARAAETLRSAEAALRGAQDQAVAADASEARARDLVASKVADFEAREDALRVMADAVTASQRRLAKRMARAERYESRLESAQQRVSQSEARIAECVGVLHAATIALSRVSLPQVSTDLGLTVYAALRRADASDEPGRGVESMGGTPTSFEQPALVSAATTLRGRVRGIQGRSGPSGSSNRGPPLPGPGRAHAVHPIRDAEATGRRRLGLDSTAMSSDSDSTEEEAPRGSRSIAVASASASITSARMPADITQNTGSGQQQATPATEEQISALTAGLAAQVSVDLVLPSCWPSQRPLSRPALCSFIRSWPAPPPCVWSSSTLLLSHAPEERSSVSDRRL